MFLLFEVTFNKIYSIFFPKPHTIIFINICLSIKFSNTPFIIFFFCFQGLWEGNRWQVTDLAVVEVTKTLWRLGHLKKNRCNSCWWLYLMVSKVFSNLDVSVIVILQANRGVQIILSVNKHKTFIFRTVSLLPCHN